MPFVTYLECANCGDRYAADEVHNLCTACGKPLWVRYDLDAVKQRLDKRELVGRASTLWRFFELLPVADPVHIVSLGEMSTPILRAPRLAAHFGMTELFIKDESSLPTGSFKARGMALAVTMANQFGLKKLAVPTAGNAGGAMAAYAARAGMRSWVFMPEDTPAINKKECHLAGARTYTVNGLIDDCGAIVARGEKEKGWFNLSTLKEPYRIEGKKTMGLELAEQLGWELPDVILYPTGGGTGLIGMWKAFGELEQMGWLDSSRKPRMIACQSTGCAPIVSAFQQGKRFAERFENASTIASGIRVPFAVGDFMIIDAIRESGGVAMAASEEGISTWMRLAASRDGIAICPETAVCLGVLDQLLESGGIDRKEKVVIFNTGAAQKYPEAVQERLPAIDLANMIPWDEI